MQCESSLRLCSHTTAQFQFLCLYATCMIFEQSTIQIFFQIRPGPLLYVDINQTWIWCVSCMNTHPHTSDSSKVSKPNRHFECWGDCLRDATIIRESEKLQEQCWFCIELWFKLTWKWGIKWTAVIAVILPCRPFIPYTLQQRDVIFSLDLLEMLGNEDIKEHWSLKIFLPPPASFLCRGCSVHIRSCICFCSVEEYIERLDQTKNLNWAWRPAVWM